MTDGRFTWAGKTVLVTGGTGTFGQAFVRYLLEREQVSAVRVFSRDELKQWEMARRLEDRRLRYFIGDVRDRDRLHRAFDGVDVVIHAAALKQVLEAEYNPFEAVKTNIIGAENVIDEAIERGVDRVVALSTDKAANPVNLYGATKLCAEKLFIQGNAYAASNPVRFCCVRYGNVVASRGSVVPLFAEQKATGLLSITDKRMTRFWMTVLEAVQFVKQAVETMHGGELFIPKLPSVRIADLAEAVAPGVPVREIGIRPGEKLHETLVTVEETRHALEAEGLFIVLPEYALELGKPWAHLSPLVTDAPYSSDRNEWWLSANELAGLLPAVLSEARAYEAGVAIAHNDSV